MDGMFLSKVPVVELFDIDGLDNIALVTNPAIEELFLAFSKEEDNKNDVEIKFAFANEEKRVVCGPAMIPDKKILRYTEDGQPFYVYFSADTIEQIAQDFLHNNKNRAWNIQHEENTYEDDVYIVESWIITNSELDKSRALGFDLPVGTWMISAKINNDELWERVKNGELRGFSIDGLFGVGNEYTELVKQIETLVEEAEREDAEKRKKSGGCY